MKVISNHPVEVGKAVDLAGAMSGSGGERILMADTIVLRENGAPVRPVLMANKTIGGSGIAPHVPELTPPSFGPSNVSTLATVFGVVRSLDYESSGFMIDDGSGVLLKCLLPSGYSLPQIDHHVLVTGIISMEQQEIGFTRTLRVRPQDTVHQL